MEDLKRREGETDEQYQVRLTLMKQNGVDIDWSEISELVDDNRSSEAFRKDSYGIRRYHKSLTQHGGMDNETLIQIKKEKVKLQNLRNSVNKDIRQLSHVENIIDLIIEKCKEINDFSFVNNDKVEFYPNGTECNLLISDLHYDGSEKPIINFNKLIDVTINKCKLHKINKINILIGGDMINNELKTTVRLENQESVSNQIVGVGKLISEGIYKLSNEVSYVTVALVTGNHCRTISNYKEALTTDTYLPIIRELVELRVSKLHNVVMLENVKDDDRFCVLNIKGKNHILCHGEGLRDLEKSSVRTIEGFLGIKADYLYLGHFHVPKEFLNYDSKIIINGALSNKSDYSKKLLLRTTEVQKLMILDINGDIECTYDIRI